MSSANDAGDPFGGRRPISHERMMGLAWDASYRGGPAPWDIGRPQQAFARVAAAGGFSGAVLDAGCGTGEHALLAASLGLSVLGVDLAETALAMARRKAGERPAYVASLASVTEHGGSLYVLCFSDSGPDIGPHPVGRELKPTGLRPGFTTTGCRPGSLQCGGFRRTARVALFRAFK